MAGSSLPSRQLQQGWLAVSYAFAVASTMFPVTASAWEAVLHVGVSAPGADGAHLETGR